MELGLVSVLLCVDEPARRQRLEVLLGAYPQLRVVAHAPVGEEGLRRAVARAPDIVAIVPDEHGVVDRALARRLRMLLPRTAVVATTAGEAPEDASESGPFPARYLPAPAGTTEIACAIADVARALSAHGDVWRVAQPHGGTA